MKAIIVLVLWMVLPGLMIAQAMAQSSPDAIETGRLLAILLDSGRVVVGANQQLINDVSKGDKGFTPEVFEKHLIAKFRERSGVDLSILQTSKVPEMAKKLLPQLVVASKITVVEAQPMINKPGVAYKGFIPATFGTRTAARFRAISGIYLKQTTTDELLRNPSNKVDILESLVLTRFADPAYPRQGEKIISFEEATENGKLLRVMLPLFYGKGCLTCHGEPKGEADISGHKKEGAKEGDLGGAISVKLPLK